VLKRGAAGKFTGWFGLHDNPNQRKKENARLGLFDFCKYRREAQPVARILYDMRGRVVPVRLDQRPPGQRRLAVSEQRVVGSYRIDTSETAPALRKLHPRVIPQAPRHAARSCRVSGCLQTPIRRPHFGAPCSRCAYYRDKKRIADRDVDPIESAAQLGRSSRYVGWPFDAENRKQDLVRCCERDVGPPWWWWLRTRGTNDVDALRVRTPARLRFNRAGDSISAFIIIRAHPL